MFRGASAINLDDKGRLAIPGRYREWLCDRCEGQMVITVNHSKERCLWIYPLDEWERVEKKVVSLPTYDPNHQRLKRFLLGYASDVEMDKQSRILVPAPLREFAKINKKGVYLVGQGNKFELWDAELWMQRCEQWLDEDLDPQKISLELEQISL